MSWDVLDDSPSLKPIVATVIAAELPVARQLAALAFEDEERRQHRHRPDQLHRGTSAGAVAAVSLIV